MIGRLPSLFGLVLLIATTAHARAGDTENPAIDVPKLLQQAEDATRAGRLVQADAMLSWMEQGHISGAERAVAFVRAEYHMANDDVAGAAAALARAGENGVDRCRRSRLSGWIASKNADWNTAILQMANAVDACGEDPALWNFFGLALVGKGEYSASLEAFDSALRLAPGHPGLLNNRALARVRAGQGESALIDLKDALARAPDDEGIQNNLDFLSGALGLAPLRNSGDTDSRWAARLKKAGEGAQQANHEQLAIAYFASATLVSDRFDAKVWTQGSASAEPKAE